jgi:succinate-acetate transporter protein
MQAAPAPAPAQAPRFAEPTSLGLFGLAIGCAALLPLAFGIKGAFTPDALRTTALFCLVFGGGCQLLAGLMDFANKNMLGATLFTTFSFNWVINAWVFHEASQGRAASSLVILSVDICFLLIFLVMTYAFGFFSKTLLVFLLDIDVLYGLRIARELLHMPSLGLPIAIAVVVLMVIALYLAFSLALANAAGRVVLPIGGPVFQAAPPPAPSPVPSSLPPPASVAPVYASPGYAGPGGTAQYRAIAG